MCDQRNNERSSEFDSTREVYNQNKQVARFHPVEVRFPLTIFNNCTRNVMNAWSDSILSPIFLAKLTFY